MKLVKLLENYQVRYNFSFLKPIIPPWNIFQQELPGLSISTDGSKINGKVGGAFVVYNNKSEVHHQCLRLSDNATVYSAKLLAIKRATEYAILNGLSNINIISDSRSVLLAMENVNNIDAEIRGTKNMIKEHPGKITLHWVKAHVGHIGNERADELAKAATLRTDADHMVAFDSRFAKKLIKKEILVVAILQKEHIFNLICGSLTADIRTLGNFFLNQNYTGHGTFAVYQARFFGIPTTCQCGHPQEDRNHIVYECPLWNEIRKKSFPKGYKNAALGLLLANSISKQGLISIMRHKLQSDLQPSEEED
ncbi:RNase H domain-containing protein [Caerostris darwini]|uniref:ribonuclease H n=1 Tax=Caerostris darwini TaxID=1538125 RepID=A0AAV4T1T9_9ARAC|nr:RNase H domain-containing protein [Caerostris darwini]